jgi:hypothetical protein
MSVVIVIGEAESTRFDGLRARHLRLSRSPAFPNDIRPQRNGLQVANGVWEHFLARTELREALYGAGGMLAIRPGLVGLRPSHLAPLRTALIRYPRTRRPGYWTVGDELPSVYDGDLARLIWLAWWTEWAIASCTHPVIQNY